MLCLRFKRGVGLGSWRGSRVKGLGGNFLFRERVREGEVFREMGNIL